MIHYIKIYGQHLLSIGIYTLSGLIGILAFFYPFLLPAFTSRVVDIQGQAAPVLTLVLLLLSLVGLLLDTQSHASSSKMVATLGVLVAVTAVLRFIEVAIPAPGGFSPIFAPIILAGYVFGARFGFLMGTMTLLVSALVTGGIGPWLPYQMFATGWVGLTAGWLPHPRNPKLELILLALLGMAWGLLYGVLLNLYTWPFLTGIGNAWQPDASLRQSVQSYIAFYLATSLVWDIARVVGNLLFIVFLGRPVIRALSRFRDRFNFQVMQSNI